MASLVAQNLPVIWETQILSLGQEGLLQAKWQRQNTQDTQETDNTPLRLEEKKTVQN